MWIVGWLVGASSICGKLVLSCMALKSHILYRWHILYGSQCRTLCRFGRMLRRLGSGRIALSANSWCVWLVSAASSQWAVGGYVVVWLGNW